MVVAGFNEDFDIMNGAVKRAESFHFQAGDGGSPDAGFERGFGEAHGDVGADAGVAAAGAAIQPGGIETQFVELILGKDKQTVPVS